MTYIETHYDRFTGRLPAINVKVYDTPTDDQIRAIAHENGDDPGRFLAWWEEFTDHPHLWDIESFVAVDELEFTRDYARELFGSDVKVLQAGRSGGWLVVDGLGDPEDWDADTLSSWETFTEHVRAQVDDFPQQVARCALINSYAAHVQYQDVDRYADLFAGTPLAGYAPAI